MGKSKEPQVKSPTGALPPAMVVGQVNEAELLVLKAQMHTRNGLNNLIALLDQRDEEVWKMLQKKYNLAYGMHRYNVDLITGEIKQAF